MTINYNVDHKLLSLPIFQEKQSALNKVVLLNILSMIVHFTKHNKQCQVWINQTAEDYGCTSRVVSNAVKRLVKANLIKEVKSWNHKTLEAAWYMACTNQVHGVHKPGAPSAQGNNIKLFQREDVVNTPPPLNKESRPNLDLDLRVETKDSWEI